MAEGFYIIGKRLLDAFTFYVADADNVQCIVFKLLFYEAVKLTLVFDLTIDALKLGMCIIRYG